MKRLRNDKSTGSVRGFSLVEVMMSITLFGLTAAAVAQMTIVATRMNAVSRDTVAAAALADDQLEWFRSLQTFDVSEMPLDVVTNDPDNPMTALSGRNGRFSRSWRLTAGPTSRTRRVAVTVRWNAPDSRSVQVSTYVCVVGTC